MEEAKPYGVTMLVTPPITSPDCLTALRMVAYTTEAGQQCYYKVEEVAALVGRLQERLRQAEGALTEAYAQVEGEQAHD